MDTHDPLTRHVARQILFTSFFLSQGSSSLQQHLFEWVAVRRNDWRLDESTQRSLSDLCGSIQALFHAGLHCIPRYSSVESELALQIQIFREALEGSHAESERDLLVQIASTMMSRDHYYLHTPEGRPRTGRKHEDPTHSRRDRYASHVCLYLLQERRLGVRVFDELLEALRDDYQRRGPVFSRLLQDPQGRVKFEELLTSYNRMHPQAQVRLPL